MELCKDFIRDLCICSVVDCKFAHPHPSVTIEQSKVIACADSLQNQCFWGSTCHYYHTPSHLQECVETSRGQCLREPNECRYAHHSPAIDNHAIVCQDFLHGKCNCKACRYSHILAHGLTQLSETQFICINCGAPMKATGSQLQPVDGQQILCWMILLRRERRGNGQFQSPHLMRVRKQIL